MTDPLINRLEAGEDVAWRMVPVEPTDAMRLAGSDVFLSATSPKGEINQVARRIYSAMLAASPPPPAVPVEEVAAIIDPWPFGIVANITHTERAKVDRAAAIAKATRIIELFKGKA